MRALFLRWTQFFLGAAIVLFLTNGIGIAPVRADTCGFRCDINYDTTGSGGSCTSDSDCRNFCQQTCASAGWSASETPTCGIATGSSGTRYCTTGNCLCVPNRVVVSCTAATGADTCAAACSDTCSSAGFASHGGSMNHGESNVRCAASPAPSCAGGGTNLAQCRTCMSECNTHGFASTDCYQSCSSDGDQPCQGISATDAGVTGGPGPGAVSGAGSGHHVHASGPSASDQAAASLAPGACATAAAAADPSDAMASHIQQIEVAFSQPSTTWVCKRICSDLEGANCVTGGCPGDASVKCCTPDVGIAPTLQCGGNGATVDATAPTDGSPTGGTAPAGGGAAPGDNGSAPAANTQTPGTGAGAGAGNNSTAAPGTGGGSVGSGQVRAPASGGITRLVLPGCISNGDCQFSDLIQMGINVVQFMFGLAGVLLLVVFIYAGIEYLLADTVTSVKSAKDRIFKAMLGLFFMFFGYTLVTFVIGLFVRP